MKVQMIYDQGSSHYREDGLVIHQNLLGVLDGVSAPYAPKYPPKMFNNLSGGEMVARLVEQFFGTVTLSRYGAMLGLVPIALPEQNLLTEVLAANAAVREAQLNFGINVEDAGEVAGVTFAIAKIRKETVEIIQTGDCFALWVKKDGSITITRNQVRPHDELMNAEILRLQREVAKENFGIELEEATQEQRGVIRKEMWNQFYHILREGRRHDANNIVSPTYYGLMNGDPRLSEVMFTIQLSRHELRTLILFSDGMVSWEIMKGMNDKELASRIYADYREGGLTRLLCIARGIEKKTEAINYVDAAEATAIALDFVGEE